jgi:hypothetical protein
MTDNLEVEIELDYLKCDLERVRKSKKKTCEIFHKIRDSDMSDDEIDLQIEICEKFGQFLEDNSYVYKIKDVSECYPDSMDGYFGIYMKKFVIKL